jgi:hypothetical protein
MANLWTNAFWWVLKRVAFSRFPPFAKKMLKFVTLLAASSLGYSICEPAIYPYSSEQIAIPLTQTVTKSIKSGNMTINIPSLTGIIQVVDGCSFSVSNLTLGEYPDLRFEWYGGFMDNAIDAISLSETPVLTGNGTTTQNFTFKRAAGSAVSFLDFNQFRLFETTTKSVLATADLPPNSQVVAPTTRNTTSGSNPSTTGTKPTPQGGNNSAFGIYPSAGLFLALMITLFA